MNINFGPFPSESWKDRNGDGMLQRRRPRLITSFLAQCYMPEWEESASLHVKFLSFLSWFQLFFFKTKTFLLHVRTSGFFRWVKRHEKPWADIHEIYSPLPRHIQNRCGSYNETHVISVGKGGTKIQTFDGMKHVAILKDDSTMVNWWFGAPRGLGFESGYPPK